MELVAVVQEEWSSLRIAQLYQQQLHFYTGNYSFYETEKALRVDIQKKLLDLFGVLVFNKPFANLINRHHLLLALDSLSAFADALQRVRLVGFFRPFLFSYRASRG